MLLRIPCCSRRWFSKCSPRVDQNMAHIVVSSHLNQGCRASLVSRPARLAIVTELILVFLSLTKHLLLQCYKGMTSSVHSWLLYSGYFGVGIEGVWELRRLDQREVTGGWRTLHDEELHNLYSSTNVIRTIISTRMRWAGHVERRERWMRTKFWLEIWRDETTWKI
jgi:hypothetical protein